MVVQRVGLHQVNDVESVRLSGLCICDSKVKPLRVASGVVVRFQNQVILIFVDLDCSAKVSALKS